MLLPSGRCRAFWLATRFKLRDLPVCLAFSVWSAACFLASLEAYLLALYTVWGLNDSMNREAMESTALWLVVCVVAFFFGYSMGTGSKQPYIESLKQQTATLQSQVRTLQADITPTDTTTAEPATVWTPPVTDTTPTSCPITTCVDGTCSDSTGRGTCSWHGGEAY